jgi:uncharacterized protein YbcI
VPALRLSAVFLLPLRGPLCQREARNGVAMTPDTPAESAHGNSASTAISNAIRQLVAEYTGRGPSRARTSIRDNVVVVLLEDTLTKGERRLVTKGRDHRVIDIRREFQDAMREDAIASVEEITGRTVAAFMSANHIDPDLAAEVFILQPDGHPASSEDPR